MALCSSKGSQPQRLLFIVRVYTIFSSIGYVLLTGTSTSGMSGFSSPTFTFSDEASALSNVLCLLQHPWHTFDQSLYLQYVSQQLICRLQNSSYCVYTSLLTTRAVEKFVVLVVIVIVAHAQFTVYNVIASIVYTACLQFTQYVLHCNRSTRFKLMLSCITWPVESSLQYSRLLSIAENQCDNVHNI